MANRWRAFYEILKFPISVLLVAFILLGIGNLLMNPVYGITSYFDYDVLNATGEILQRTGSFLIVNFPLLFLFRLVSGKSGNSVTVLSAFAGFVIFHVVTMLVARSDLTTTAYSSILGLSITRSSISKLTSGTHYPLQTGLIGAWVIAWITRFSFSKMKKKNGMISGETGCVILTMVLSLIAGLIFSVAWPYVIMVVNKGISCITGDTTSPVNLGVYGIMDRLFSTMNLGTLIRQPFWYTVNGGSWVSAAGASVTGDVNIWTAQVEANAVTGMSGRFITPYYVLNLFAIPGMVIAMYSLHTGRHEKRKARGLCILVILVSLLSGCLLPVELFLLFLCPVLFLIHLGLTGCLFGVLQSLHLYLGYRSEEASTMTALPGTLPEFLSYLNMPGLRKTLLGIVITGVVMFFVYYLITKFYFRSLTVGMFDVKKKQVIVEEILKALGGTENIRSTDCSVTELTVSLYDPDLIDVEKLMKLGSYRVYEFNGGYNLCFGNASVMIRNGIRNALRDSVRDLS